MRFEGKNAKTYHFTKPSGQTRELNECPYTLQYSHMRKSDLLQRHLISCQGNGSTKAHLDIFQFRVFGHPGWSK